MSRLFVTGDTHGSIDIHKLSLQNWPAQKELTKQDIVVILGDFGLVWTEKHLKEENYWLKWLNDKPFTTMFIPGNHECYPRLRAYPLHSDYGGKVRYIRDSVIMLENGYVFNLCGHDCFCMGGASSYDREYRIEGKDWWPEEIPSRVEMANALGRLIQADNEVDQIFTHCGPNALMNRLYSTPAYDEMTQFLQVVHHKVLRANWFCGHYHQDRTVEDSATHQTFNILYQDIIEILPDNTWRLACS